MGREVRRVPANWEHPKEYQHYRGEECYRPMMRSFNDAFDQWLNNELPEWLERREKWQQGLVSDYRGGWKPIPWDEWRNGPDAYRYENIKLYEDYAGICPASPDPKDYMPDWPDAERTHWQMYEDTSEGTPISPVCETPEELARWLADNGASSFAGDTATYEQWLKLIVGRGYTIASGVLGPDGWKNGVAATAELDD